MKTNLTILLCTLASYTMTSSCGPIPALTTGSRSSPSSSSSSSSSHDQDIAFPDHIQRHMDRSKEAILDKGIHRVHQLESAVKLLKAHQYPTMTLTEEERRKDKNKVAYIGANSQLSKPETSKEMNELHAISEDHVAELQVMGHPRLHEAVQHRDDVKKVASWMGFNGQMNAPHRLVTPYSTQSASEAVKVTPRRGFNILKKDDTVNVRDRAIEIFGKDAKEANALLERNVVLKGGHPSRSKSI